jgi:hypothetical protein
MKKKKKKKKKANKNIPSMMKKRVGKIDRPTLHCTGEVKEMIMSLVITQKEMLLERINMRDSRKKEGK